MSQFYQRQNFKEKKKYKEEEKKTRNQLQFWTRFELRALSITMFKFRQQLLDGDKRIYSCTEGVWSLSEHFLQTIYKEKKMDANY